MPAPLKLLTLRTPGPQFDPAQGAAGLPQRILVMPWGRNETTQGPVIVNETTVQMLAAYNRSQNWDTPYWDFEHASVPGSQTYQGEPVHIAATGVRLDAGGVEIVPGEGVYQLTGTYTPEGLKFVGSGHYPDLSPVVKVNEQNEMIGLHSTAFCRHGATTGLIFLSATSTPSQSNMDPKPPQTADELAAALKTLLGLGADAAPAEVLAALSAKMKAEPAAASGGEDVKQLTALVTSLTETVKGQDTTLKLLSTTLEAGQRAEILLQAAREGKDVPKTAAEKMPLADLKLLCAELPVTVPLDKRTVALGTLMLTSTPGASPDAEEVSKLTGVSKEDREKYGA